MAGGSGTGVGVGVGSSGAHASPLRISTSHTIPLTSKRGSASRSSEATTSASQKHLRSSAFIQAMTSQHSLASLTSRLASWPSNTPVQSSEMLDAPSAHVVGGARTTGGCAGDGGGGCGRGIVMMAGGEGGGRTLSSHLVRLTIPLVHRTPSPLFHAGTGNCVHISSARNLSQHSRCL
jgi:hypothetical protein